MQFLSTTKATFDHCLPLALTISTPASKKKSFDSTLAAEHAASYKAKYFIAVPALGHPVHLFFSYANIPHV